MSSTDRATKAGSLTLAAWAVLLAVGTYAVMTASLRLFILPGFTSPLWWPVAAVAIVVLIRCPRRWWPVLLTAFAAGSVAASMRAGSWTLTITYVVVNLVEVLVAALVITDPRKPARRRLRVPVNAARVALAAVISVCVGVVVIMVSSSMFPTDAPMYDVIDGYAVSHLLGLASLAPLLLPGKLAWRLRGWAVGELAVALAACAALGTWSFLTHSAGARAFPALIFVIWIAIRFSAPWATVASVMTITAVAYGTTRDLGTFGALADIGGRNLGAQMFVATAAAATLALVLIARHRAVLAEQVRDSESTLRLAIDHALVGMYSIRLDREHRGEIVEANRAISELLGYRHGELDGRHCRILGYGPDALHTATAEELESFDRHLTALADGTQASFRMESDMRTKDGARLWVEVAVTRVEPKHLPPFALIHVHDLTSRRDHNRKLEQLALHDPLTGLANRVLLFRRVDHALGTALGTASGTALGTASGSGTDDTVDLSGRRHSQVGLLYVDLDEFKLVNDTYGHAAGDAVLVDVAHRLTRAVRPGDTVARLGGDEFAVFCSPITDDAELARIASRIRTALTTPTLLADGTSVPIRASVGQAVAEAGTDSDALIREADAAMYREKAISAARLTSAFEK